MPTAAVTSLIHVNCARALRTCPACGGMHPVDPLTGKRPEDVARERRAAGRKPKVQGD